MTDKEFIKKLKLALNSPTKYVSPSSQWGSFIDGKFIFDCCLLIKAIGWGWYADRDKVHGGAIYKSNNVPDYSCYNMIKDCTDISSNFSVISVGELVYMNDHVGIYIGDGKVIECTIAWNKRSVVESEISDKGIRTLNGKKPVNYQWKKHGKIKWIKYTNYYPIMNWQNACIKDGYTALSADGEWGIYSERCARTMTVQKDTKNKNLCLFLQKVLTDKHLYSGSLDGVCGSYTVKAIKDYQTANKLYVDGVAGYYTWKHILGV